MDPPPASSTHKTRRHRGDNSDGGDSKPWRRHRRKYKHHRHRTNMSVSYSHYAQANVSPLSGDDNDDDDCSRGYPYDAERGAPLDFDGPLPEPTSSQRAAVGDFITSPSEDRWHRLVESMRREEELVGVMRQQEEEEMVEFCESTGNDPTRSDAEKTRDALNIVDSILRPGERLDPPASEHEEDMLGWSLGQRQARRDEASRQLDSILGDADAHYKEADDDEESTYPSTCSSGSCNSFGKGPRRPVTSKFVFLASFLVGMAAVIAVSFVVGLFVGRNPREEIRHVALRFHSKEDALGDSRDILDETSDANQLFPFQDGGVDELLRAEFCGECPWQGASFSCKTRVKWEVREFGSTVEEAMRDNLEFCQRPGTASSP